MRRTACCDDAVRAGDGKVEASLTAAIPYAALQASERLKLWGAAGYGTGEVTLKTALGGSYKSDTSWSMAAAGLRGDLLAPPGGGFPRIGVRGRRTGAGGDLGRPVDADLVGEDPRPGGVGLRRDPAQARPGGQLPAWPLRAAVI